MSICEGFIKCVRCKCKHLNDEEHVKLIFGYKNSGERYAKCLKCREKAKVNIDNKPFKIYLFEELPYERFIIRYRINDKVKKTVY